MAEPTSSSSAAGIFAWKAIGGAAGVAAGGAGLAAIVRYLNRFDADHVRMP
jgi:hypothetical protein